MNIKKQLADIRELLNMAAAQTVANAKQRKKHRERFDLELQKSRQEHDREMKEIRRLLGHCRCEPIS